MDIYGWIFLEIIKMDNTTRRKMRIDQILNKIIESRGVNKEELISFCSVHYGLSRRTTKEYLNDLCKLKYAELQEDDIIPLTKIPKRKKQGSEFDEIINNM